MKRTIIVLCFLLLSSSHIYSQIIFSNGTGGGDWTSASTWLGGNVPGTNSDVIIAGTDSVLASASGLACNSLTLLSGSKFATSIDSFIVSGALTVEADAWYYNRVTSPTLAGSEIILDPQSYVVHIGSGTVGGPNNYEYGNLVIQRIAGCTAAADLVINGNLILNMAAGQVFRGARPSVDTSSRHHTVYGDVIINKGILSCVDVGSPTMSCVWDILGSVYVVDTDDAVFLESRIGPFSSANADGLGIINIGGDLIVDGGRLQAGTSSTSGPGRGIVNLAGDFRVSVTSAISTNSLGAFSFNFTGTDPQTVYLERPFSMTVPVYDTVKTGASVIFNFDTLRWASTAGGNFVVEGSLEFKGNTRFRGPGNFTLNPGATLKIGSDVGLLATDTANGNIQNTGTRTFSTEANYEYSGTNTQVLGDGLPLTVGGLTVNNGSSIVLFGNYTVNNSLNLVNGFIDLNSSTLTLGPNAVLTETIGNTVRGAAGKITTTRNVSAPVANNIGGLGAMLTTTADLGSTTIERFHSVPIVLSDKPGISRYYNIIPGQNNSGLNAIVRIYYDDSELNGLDESTLRIFKSATAANNSWTEAGGIVNPDQNYVEVAGVGDFSYWTLAETQFVSVDESKSGIPGKFSLAQNYPNPFNPETVIRFDIPGSSFVNISVYNALGEKVATLVNEQLNGGYYQKTFNPSEIGGLSSGVYIYKLSATGISGNISLSGKMMLMK